MSIRNLLYKNELVINDSIKIVIPTVGQILDNEERYYGLVSQLVAMPIDLMVPLDDAGIDFTQINEYDLFLLLFPNLQTQDTSLIFGDLDLKKFSLAINEENGMTVMLDKENDIIIDRAIYGRIADSLRQIHHIEKNIKKPANKEAQDYLLERARKKLKRRMGRTEDSQIESLITAMVNTQQFKYTFEGVRDLTIYQFNESVKQVVKKVDYENKMFGVYTGNLDVKTLNQDDLNWLVHK
jgi:hypothetical protein